MINWVEKILLIALVAMAFAAVVTSSLKRAIIFMGILSLIASFIYLLYSAPDVAIAEAVIGCGMATVLYLVSLKRQRTMTVYYVHSNRDALDDASVPISATRLLNEIESYFEGRDLGAHVIHTVRQKGEIIGKKDYDLIVCSDSDCLTVYGRKGDSHVDEVEDMLKTSSIRGIQVIRVFENGGRG